VKFPGPTRQGHKWGTHKTEVLKHRSEAHCLVVTKKRNARGAKGAGHPRLDGVNGQPEELLVLADGGSLLGVARAG
jgi:hypothetical protein